MPVSDPRPQDCTPLRCAACWAPIEHDELRAAWTCNACGHRVDEQAYIAWTYSLTRVPGRVIGPAPGWATRAPAAARVLADLVNRAR